MRPKHAKYIRFNRILFTALLEASNGSTFRKETHGWKTTLHIEVKNDATAHLLQVARNYLDTNSQSQERGGWGLATEITEMGPCRLLPSSQSHQECHSKGNCQNIWYMKF
jgi:hypothetical protein